MSVNKWALNSNSYTIIIQQLVNYAKDLKNKRAFTIFYFNKNLIKIKQVFKETQLGNRIGRPDSIYFKIPLESRYLYKTIKSKVL